MSLSFSVAQAVALPDDWELGYPDGPGMYEYKLQLEQFVSEWDQMQSTLPVTHIVLEIGNKSSEDLLQEIIIEMQSTFYFFYHKCLKCDNVTPDKVCDPQNHFSMWPGSFHQWTRMRKQRSLRP